MRNAHKYLFGNPEEQRLRGRPSRREIITFKYISKKVKRGLNLSGLELGPMAGFFEHDNEYLIV
jgi:hypothetical protein